MSTHTAQHTPGEWTRRQAYSSGEPQEQVIQSGTDVLASVYHLGNDRQEEYESNAHLIAAAPAMYEALKELLECNELCADVDSLESRTITRIRAGQAALAQAEGRGDT